MSGITLHTGELYTVTDSTGTVRYKGESKVSAKVMCDYLGAQERAALPSEPSEVVVPKPNIELDELASFIRTLPNPFENLAQMIASLGVPKEYVCPQPAPVTGQDEETARELIEWIYRVGNKELLLDEYMKIIQRIRTEAYNKGRAEKGEGK